MINSIFVYDNSEPDNCEAWKNLPVFFQEFICERHNQLRNVVYKLLKFTDTGCEPIFTSGFRSISINRQCGGVQDSLHLHGLAIDFILANKYKEIIPCKAYNQIFREEFKEFYEKELIDRYTLIPENTHFHLQFKRGV